MTVVRKLITMRECLDDPDFLGAPDMFAAPSWRAWRVILIAAMGEALTDDERVTFHELTGRERETGTVAEEVWAVVGRRGGKSRAIAALAAYLAACVDYRGILAPGQFGTVPVVSASKDQAGEIYDYVAGIFANAPGFTRLLACDPTSDTITLKTRIVISVKAANFRRVRGFTAVAFIGDEACFWTSETSANPDREIIAGARPSLATTGGILVIISSPYGKRGEVYKTFTRHYGAEGNANILVVKASSRQTNPDLSDRVIARAYEDDPINAACEYGGEFRNDVDAFLSEEVVSPLILQGVFEIPPTSGAHYTGFVDAASGGGADSMTLGIAFMDAKVATLACLIERKPRFDPETVTAEFAETQKRYRISRVKGDRWAAGFVDAAFRRNGITYEASDLTKSDIYREAMPLINAGQVRFLDNRKLTVQLLGLERRVARGGKDNIDHAPGGHDDLCNAACGALVNANARQPLVISEGAMAWARMSPQAYRMHQLMRED